MNQTYLGPIQFFCPHCQLYSLRQSCLAYCKVYTVYIYLRWSVNQTYLGPYWNQLVNGIIWKKAWLLPNQFRVTYKVRKSILNLLKSTENFASKYHEAVFFKPGSCIFILNESTITSPYLPIASPIPNLINFT